MTSIRSSLILCLAALSLAACGGGGGGSSSSSTSTTTTTTAATYPTSGTYSWTLRENNTTSSPAYGIAFAHPSTPLVSYTVEAASAGVTDVIEIDSGTVSSSGQVSGVTPNSLVYIANGVLKRVSLVADGVAPAGVQSITSGEFFCSFKIAAINYATPDSSRLVISTAGPDGQCATADDGQATVTLTTTGGTSLVSNVAVGSAVTEFALLRNPTTYAPEAWVNAEGVDVFGATVPKQYVENSSTLFTSAVVAAPTSALMQRDGALVVQNYVDASTTPTVTSVSDSTGTAWKGIGYDATRFYAYLNSTNSTTGALSWQVLAVNRATGASGLLDSGSGSVSITSMGNASLYITVASATSGSSTVNQLITISKETGASAIRESSATTTTDYVLASAASLDYWVHSTTAAEPTITVVDENFAPVQAFAASVASFYVAPTALDLNLSENRIELVFLQGYNADGAASSQITSYNTQTQVTTNIGALPADASFGGDPVLFLGSGGGNPALLTGFAAGTSDGAFVTSTIKLLTFNPGTAGSLKVTTTTFPD